MLLVLGHEVVREIAVKEVKSFGEVVVEGVAVAAIKELAELREEVFGFNGMGLISQGIIVDRFRSAQLVNAVKSEQC